MKNLIFSILFFLTSFSISQESTTPENLGVRAKVELVSGVTQYAQFLGIHQDTVSLGGKIKGKFTVIKITKDRFKSIVDEQGVDLLNPAPTPSTEAVTEPTEENPTVTEPTDSASIDSATAEVTPEFVPTFLDSVQNKHIFIALEKRSIDSALEAQVTPVLMQLLKESGVPLTFAKRTDFGYCRSSNCFRDSLAKHGAADFYDGSIIAAPNQDSLVLQMTYTNLQDPSTNPHSAQITLSVFKGLSSVIENNKLSNFIKQLHGKAIPQKSKFISYIKMESNPEGAIITIPEQGDICKTPCTFTTQDTGKIDLYAYWNVNNQIWGTKKTIRPIAEDTAKFSVKLKKSNPELRVFTIPEDAYIFAGSAPLTPSTSPIGKSPDRFSINEPGTSYIQIRKEGYRDTLVTFFASPTEITNVSVNLEPITSPSELETQSLWIKERKKNFIGKVLMGSSIAPILAGALLTYLAIQDYDDAKQIKNELSIPSSFSGEHYQARVHKNHDLVNKGKRKMIGGTTLIGTGVLMLGIGIVLTF